MRRLASVVPWTVTVLLVLTTLRLAPVNAAGPARARIGVRVYEQTAIRPAVRAAALAQAAALLSKASVELTFVVCRVRGREGWGCGVPLTTDEVVLRIARSASQQLGPDVPLGQALVDQTQRRGVLATVYLEPIARMALASGGDSTMLLGRVIAHEIGHLLMATASHDTGGLMRAMWSSSELRREHAIDWMLSSKTADRLRQRAGAPSLEPEPAGIEPGSFQDVEM